MEYLHRKACALTDLDGLANGLHDLFAFAANVARIDTAVLRRDLGDRHQLVGFRETRRRINQRGRHAHRAGTHGGVHDRPHAIEFRFRWRARRLPQHRDARLRLTEVAAEVDADALPLERREIFCDLRGRHWCATFTADRGGHAHAQLVFGEAAARQHAARLVHHVDPARRDILALRVDLPAPATGHASDSHKPAIVDGHVGQNPRISRPVQHAAMANDHIVHAVGRRRRTRPRSDRLHGAYGGRRAAGRRAANNEQTGYKAAHDHVAQICVSTRRKLPPRIPSMFASLYLRRISPSARSNMRRG